MNHVSCGRDEIEWNGPHGEPLGAKMDAVNALTAVDVNIEFTPHTIKFSVAHTHKKAVLWSHGEETTEHHEQAFFLSECPSNSCV